MDHKRLFQCLPLLAAVAADICAADRPCVRSRRLGAFYQQYHAAIDCGTASRRKVWFIESLFVILATALVTGIVNYVFFPHVQLLGASGVVFAFILLSPFTSVKEGSIPITLVLVAALYIGGQIYSGVSSHDNVSHLTHIIGGCVGAGLGYVMHKNKMNRY